MHNFCLLNIKRPVLSSVFSLLLVVFGLYTFFELSTRELPKNLQPPEVVISTKYTGASPSIIASEISEPIELAVGGAESIKSIDTLSEIGRSTIRIEFFGDIDVDDAANDIRERISRILDDLPENSKAPEVRKASAGFSTSMWLTVSSTSWNSLDIGDYVKRNEKYVLGFDPLATITYNRGVITLIGDEMWRVQQIVSKTSAKIGES